MTISKNRLRDLLVQGRRISSQRYFERCVTHHAKTFYFFCERLSKVDANAPLSSTELNDYIVAQLRAREVDVNNQFNPQGWFGKAWTDWSDPSKNERNFRNEYRDVLVRTDTEPYSYQIRPECLPDVIEIFHEFKRSASN